jgi:acetyltransferase-like isoleucine patch superfamily enzyme
MWAGNHVGHHGTVRDHVFITSHVVVSGHCDIKNYCWLGVNSTIRDFTVLAEGTMLGASTNVTKSINEAYGVYIGNPAKRIGNVD